MEISETQPEIKRRKVRKGTQSCWECRRRKVRCIFTLPLNASCDNCRRRGTTCISQDLPEELLPAACQKPVEERLSRVEGLIEQLVCNASTLHAKERRSDIPDSVTQKDRDGPGQNIALEASNSNSRVRIPEVPQSRTPDKYEGLSRELIAAWPNQDDLDLIYSIPAGPLVYHACSVCVPFSSSMAQDPQPTREIFRLPQQGSHPVLIARKLLMLGTFLQSIFPSLIKRREEGGASYRKIMVRLVETSIRLVTTKDELTGSLEGVECIMLEAIYHNFEGNLHRAWLAVRRATAVAQMMALHRGLESPSLKILDPDNRVAFYPDHLCFRLVEMDRYLCLMLGLPQASFEGKVANLKSPEACHPHERMRRLHCIIAGRILQRNDVDVHNFAITHEIDRLLQTAAGAMPAQWWLVPNLQPSTTDGDDSTELFENKTRLMDQFAHYHLLIRLHLPYMLRPSSDRRYDSSKIAALNASRETLSRYVVFHTCNPTHLYCRGTDFLAFIATIVMCLAHVESRKQSPGDIGSALAHSRPSDRGMMERTLEIIESMSRSGADPIATKLSRIIQPLLTIEAQAAKGVTYITTASKGDEGRYEWDGTVTEGSRGSSSSNSLKIYIPYFGTINFENAGSTASSNSSDPLLLQTSSTQEQFPSPQGSIMNGFLGLADSNTQPMQLHVPAEPLDIDNDWDLQGIDVALFDSLFRGIVSPDVIGSETWSVCANIEKNT